MGGHAEEPCEYLSLSNLVPLTWVCVVKICMITTLKTKAHEGGREEVEKRKTPPNVDSQKKSETPQFASLCASKSFAKSKQTSF